VFIALPFGPLIEAPDPCRNVIHGFVRRTIRKRIRWRCYVNKEGIKNILIHQLPVLRTKYNFTPFDWAIVPTTAKTFSGYSHSFLSFHHSLNVSSRQPSPTCRCFKDVVIIIKINSYARSHIARVAGQTVSKMKDTHNYFGLDKGYIRSDLETSLKY